MERFSWMRRVLALAVLAPMTVTGAALAQTPAPPPEVLDPDLAVRTTVSGLTQPTSMAFIGNNDFLVLEKASGQVKRVRNGAVPDTVLDLAVNSNSERGLLGIALHRKFKRNGWVYLFWSESRTGADSTTGDEVRLMGNRIDRFEWEDGRLEFDRNIIKFRAFQQDRPAALPRQPRRRCDPLRPRRQAIRSSATPGAAGRRRTSRRARSRRPAGDDQFGGPEPDDLHLTG